MALVLLLPSAAGASNFEALEYPAAVTGTQEGTFVFKTEAGSLECPEGTFSGTLSEASSTLSLLPTFAKCKAFGFLEATVTPEGCVFVLHAGAETSLYNFSGTTDISCGEGKSIKVTTATCTAAIGSQSGLSSVSYVDQVETMPEKFKFGANLSGIGYTVTKDGFACPFNGTGAKTGGTMTEAAVVKASGENFVAVRDTLTTLCKVKAAACTAAERLGIGTVFEGKSLNSEVEFPAAAHTIACAESVLKGKTELDRFTPLPVELKALSFASCKLDGGNACEVRAPGLPRNGTGIVAYGNETTGDWRLKSTELIFECPPPVEAGLAKCEFVGGNPVVQIVGAAKASESVTKGEFPKKAGAPASCPASVKWSGFYNVESPAPLYVTLE